MVPNGVDVISNILDGHMTLDNVSKKAFGTGVQ